jgi:large subunit ribosomal protein L5
MSELKKKYQKEIVPELKKVLKLGNDLAVPSVEKVIINVGLGEAVSNPQALEAMKKDLTLITGQRPIVTKSKKAISNFNLRQGVAIGLKVTLRRDRLWDFFDKLVNIVLPRVKDFRGVSRDSFDGRGNYSLGIREHTVFPEVDTSEVGKIRSLQITIITTAQNDNDGMLLLEKLGIPFAKEQDVKVLERMREQIKKEKNEKEDLKSRRKAEGKLNGKEEQK